MEYRGLVYPIERTPYGFFAPGNNLQQIKASLLTIIMTRPGERIMRPHFGTSLHKLQRRPMDVIASEARTMIAHSIKRFEKRIQVTEIDCSLTADGMLDVTVYFIDPNTNLQEIQTLTLQVQLFD